MGRQVPLTLPATTSIVNKYSAGGVSTANIAVGAHGVAVASGSGTANTLASLLTVSGAGYVPYLICYSNSATPTHTVRCVVIVDGVTVFDATSNSIAASPNNPGMVVVDAVQSGVSNAIPSGWLIRFNSSLVVQACSSQTGTDYVAIRYELQRTA